MLYMLFGRGGCEWHKSIQIVNNIDMDICIGMDRDTDALVDMVMDMCAFNKDEGGGGG